MIEKILQIKIKGLKMGQKGEGMARRGENIRKRKDGRWEGRYSVLTAGGKKTHSVYARTYAEIKKKLTYAKETEQSKPQPIAAMAGYGENTFRDIALAWLQHIREKRKYSTYVKYRDLYYRYLTELDNILFADLSEDMILGRLSLLNEQESPVLKYSVYGILNQMIRFGNAKGGYSVMPFARKRENARKKGVEIFNISEQQKLFRVLYEGADRYKKGILICLFTGLRLGEISALKWSDINFETKTLHVNMTVQRIAVEGYPTKTILFENPPKSDCSLREIPLSDSMIEVLNSIPRCGIYVINGDRPMEPRTYENKLKSYLKEAGIIPRNFHTLRHTFATNCIESGMDVKSLSEILGHADVQLTLNRYVHPTIETKRHHMNSLCSIYGHSLGRFS